MIGTTSLPLPHSAPPAGPLSRGENGVNPGIIYPILDEVPTEVNRVQSSPLVGLLLPDISPGCVGGKTMVLLLISTRAGGDCGVCGGTGFVVASLLTGSTGVAACGSRADRLVFAGAAETSRARSGRIWTFMN